ncbi:hypothetical protein D3C77_655980 [compost metagenome]
MTIGDYQVLAAGLDKFGGPAQQTPEIRAVEVGDHQPNAVGAFVRQRLGEEVRAVTQFVHRLEHRVAGAFFHLAGAI